MFSYRTIHTYFELDFAVVYLRMSPHGQTGQKVQHFQELHSGLFMNISAWLDWSKGRTFSKIV